MKYSGKIILLLILSFLSISIYPQEILLDNIQLPEGYAIEVYADSILNARAMDFADDGTLFVGSRKAGNIYAVTPEKQVILLDTGLTMPCGIDWFERDLYVSSVSRILKYPDILEQSIGSPEKMVINEQFPAELWHGWKFIKVGPDRKLYVPVGAACNVCDSSNIIYATICRMNLDGSNLEIFAEGVRNTVGFDWDPYDNSLWFTDNGRDYVSDDEPPDELNKAPLHGLHYGFPYIHGTTYRDPEFWSLRPMGTVFTSPKVKLPAHVAALGMRFYTGDMFGPEYDGGIFIAEHGSWNRSNKIGYRITFVPVEEGYSGEYSVFASGWLIGQTPWGRPADVEIGPDGALYVSDDMANCIYRIFKK